MDLTKSFKIKSLRNLLWEGDTCTTFFFFLKIFFLKKEGAGTTLNMYDWNGVSSVSVGTGPPRKVEGNQSNGQHFNFWRYIIWIHTADGRKNGRFEVLWSAKRLSEIVFDIDMIFLWLICLSLKGKMIHLDCLIWHLSPSFSPYESQMPRQISDRSRSV